MTYFQFKKYLKDSLFEIAGEYAAYEAEKILLHLTGMDRTALSLRLCEEMPHVPEQTEDMLARRKSGEPLAYILGRTEFFGLELYVSEACLTPRADTEVIVEKALELLGCKRARVLDLCTGSGCIALAIAANSHAEVLGVDVSPAALCVAEKNAHKCALTEKVRFRLCNVLSADFAQETERFDLIVSNPPYIPTADIASLSAEVHREPALALDGGEDGLVFYRRFLEILPRKLNPGGAIVFEIGYDQEAGLRSLCENAGLAHEFFRDYGGNVRCVVIKKQK